MKVIGLCGGSGSGKGTVCDVFRENGIPTIDTDAVYRELTGMPGSLVDALRAEFGDSIITADGTLDRRSLATLIFNSPDATDKLKRLNAIAHKYILDETRNRLYSYSLGGAPLGVVDAPVLFESGFDSECDIIVSVIADKNIRIERIICRDGIGREEAERRIAAQMSDEQLISKSDFVIYNNSDLTNLRGQVDRLIANLI